VMKTDLAGGRLPSGRDLPKVPSGEAGWNGNARVFGANAAWWALMILAHNLNTAMKRLGLGTGWLPKRMKALRSRLIGLPGAGGQPRPQADHPPGSGCRGAGADHLCPSGHPGAGMRAVRMISRRKPGLKRKCARPLTRLAVCSGILDDWPP
jgi:hypothetical protein